MSTSNCYKESLQLRVKSGLRYFEMRPVAGPLFFFASFSISLFLSFSLSLPTLPYQLSFLLFLVFFSSSPMTEYLLCSLFTLSHCLSLFFRPKNSCRFWSFILPLVFHLWMRFLHPFHLESHTHTQTQRHTAHNISILFLFFMPFAVGMHLWWWRKKQ